MTDSTSITEPATVREEDHQPPKPDRPPWPELQVGERVRLSLDVEVVHSLGDGRDAFRLTDEDGPTGRGIFIDIPHGHPQVEITRGAPADGVPRAGELWADDNDNVYFAVSPAAGDGCAQGEPVLVGKEALSKAQWLDAVLDVPWREVHTGPDGPIRRLMSVDDIARYR